MSDSFPPANTDSNQILYRFIVNNKKLGNIERPHLVAKEILTWTQDNTLLTQNLCQLILDRHDKVIEGQETDYVKRIVRSLVKYWENNPNSDYYPHFKSIKDSILENQQVTTVLLRLHEILLQKEVVATESLEDSILLKSGKSDFLRYQKPIQL